MQTTFDHSSFVRIKSNRKRFFYFDTTLNQSRPQWLCQRPTKVNFEAQIQWRDLNYPVTVCGYSEDAPYCIPQEDRYTNVSFLKSHLQKCVRRQLSLPTIATAWHLIKLDLNEFIRRLPIIMLEDVTLFEEFDTVIWLMVAISKNYQPSLSQIQWLIQLCGNLSLSSQVAEITHSHHCNSIKVSDLIKEIDSDSTLNEVQKNTFYCLAFRMAYGGMKGDMNMLLNFIQYYKSNNTLIPSIANWDFDQLSSLCSLIEIPHLAKDMIEISAVDFHCFPYILDKIVTEFPAYSKQDLKECIWEFSSKLNMRRKDPPDSQWQSLWADISPFFFKLQRSILSSILC
jgi:hypothetical protein